VIAPVSSDLDLAYRRSPDQDRGKPAHHPVIVAGGGPVGLALAIDLRLRGVPALVLESDQGLATGSRAICYAKRSLEILDRLGIGQRMLDRGVIWKQGKVFWRERLVYEFDLLPETGHRMPAFVNLQQFHLEQYLVERAVELGVEVRFGHALRDLAARPGGASLTVETPDGPYALECDWLLACDGAHSTVRRTLGLPFEGQVFHDRFLITDVRMDADFPPERWFWFDPPFHQRQSALLHAQADRVWRIDLQLGWGADPEVELEPERVRARLEAMLGPERPFEIVWTSIYTFRCRRLPHFRHGRVLFLGDAAHQVSPFGARGFNGGLQDADNLAWKLALVLGGQAPDALLETFCAEREPAADENIKHSTRSTEFITPKSEASRTLRDAVLALAADHPFARRLINSGRLSTPHSYLASPLGTPDRDAFAGGPPPGTPALDAPLSIGGRPAWLTSQLGEGFALLAFVASAKEAPAALDRLARAPLPVVPRLIVTGREPVPPEVQGIFTFADAEGLAAARYDAPPGTVYLFRPDQHVAARWRQLDVEAIEAAARRATGAPALVRAGASA
jgi:3-(3-hydroxy-phenyl)propionate hydroxylase